MAAKVKMLKQVKAVRENCGHMEHSNIISCKNKCFLMHVAKCLILLVFNVKKECKMLMDCFIQSQLVSILINLEK